MAKVHKLEIRIGKKKHEYDVHFSSKEKQFHIKNFPQEILSMIGKSAFQVVERFDRIVDLENSVRDVLTTYYERIETTRKVIIYSVDFSKEYRMNRSNLNSWSGPNPDFDIPKRFDPPFSTKNGMEGYGISFDYHVAMEVKGAEDRYIRQWRNKQGIIEMDSGGTRLAAGEAVMDWTEEREAFFENMKSVMDVLAQKFCTFFGKDEKDILSIMDSGAKLLLAENTI